MIEFAVDQPGSAFVQALNSGQWMNSSGRMMSSANWIPVATRGFQVENTAAIEVDVALKYLIEFLSSRTAASESILSPASRNLVRAGNAAEAVDSRAPRETLFEIRRLTGFTWEEVGTLLNVDRRTLHNWIKGHPVRRGNLGQLAEVLATLRYIDRGSAEQNRIILGARCSSGETIWDSIARKQYDDAKRSAGPGAARAYSRWSQVSADWVDAYGPSLELSQVEKNPDFSSASSDENDSPTPRPDRKRRIRRE